MASFLAENTPPKTKQGNPLPANRREEGGRPVLGATGRSGGGELQPVPGPSGLGQKRAVEEPVAGPSGLQKKAKKQLLPVPAGGNEDSSGDEFEFMVPRIFTQETRPPPVPARPPSPLQNEEEQPAAEGEEDPGEREVENPAAVRGRLSQLVPVQPGDMTITRTQQQQEVAEGGRVITQQAAVVERKEGEGPAQQLVYNFSNLTNCTFNFGK